jgi:hypothetical protein
VTCVIYIVINVDTLEPVNVKDIVRQELHVNNRPLKRKLVEESEPHFTDTSRFTDWVSKKYVMNRGKILEYLLDDVVDRLFETTTKEGKVLLIVKQL